MFVIMGATGHVGSAAASALLETGEAVTVVTRDAAKGEPWRARGAEVAVADVLDVDSLRAAFRRGRRAFLLNPPGDTTGDPDAAERRSVAAILAALEGSGLEAVVAESTYGARPGGVCGDLTTLHALEQGLAAQPIPAAVIRAAYYMSNWDPQVPAAREQGVVRSTFPADFPLPMVSPADLGAEAARLLRSPTPGGLHHVEGPRRYTAEDVAEALTEVLGRPVRVEVTPREAWEAGFVALGFSAAAAASYARMTAATLDDGFPEPDVRGRVTLREHLQRQAEAAADRR